MTSFQKKRIVECNVFIVASAADPKSPFDDSDHLTPAERATVFEWTKSFRADSSQLLVLDTEYEVWRDYTKQLGPQDYGFLVAQQKLALGEADWQKIKFVSKGIAALPKKLEAVIHDAEDRKYVALALANGGSADLVNACDSDYFAWRDELAGHGVRVTELLSAYCERVHNRKAAKAKSKKRERNSRRSPRHHK